LQQGKAAEVKASPELQKLAATPTATAATSKTKEQPTTATKTPAASTPPKEITVPLEPKAAAKVLVKAFDKRQLVQLVKLLAQATRTSS
jgi:hypothetical protein